MVKLNKVFLKSDEYYRMSKLCINKDYNLKNEIDLGSEFIKESLKGKLTHLKNDWRDGDYYIQQEFADYDWCNYGVINTKKACSKEFINALAEPIYHLSKKQPLWTFQIVCEVAYDPITEFELNGDFFIRGDTIYFEDNGQDYIKKLGLED